MSFNISREDLGGSTNLWGKRKDAVLNMLKVNSPAVIGLQECSWTIRGDILADDADRRALGISVSGQESGYTKESSNTIIYDDTVLESLNSGTFWLSSTPDVVSNTWGDADKQRICTWAKFRTRNTVAKSFYVFNLHLESDADISDRSKALKVVLDKVMTINTENLPVIILGDHNDKENDLIAYQGSGFTSVRQSASITDEEPTLNGFGHDYDSNDDGIDDIDTVIDHIYVKGCTANHFYVDRSRYNGRDYISDHYPVVCDLTLN